MIGATHDTMDPEHMRWVSAQVQHGSFLLSHSGSHFAMWDDQQVYLRGLLKFLDAIDQGMAGGEVPCSLPSQPASTRTLPRFGGTWMWDAVECGIKVRCQIRRKNHNAVERFQLA